MTQTDIARVLQSARDGRRLMVAYESPQGNRRFAIPIVAVKRNAKGEVVKVQLERGTAVWMYIQRAKQEDGDVRWYFFQPNPYPIDEVALD